jgi:hypothetical protein
VAGSGPPAERSSPRMTWDTKRERVILFGGQSGATSPTDTWAWDRKAWSVLAEDGPPGRTVHALTFDEARGATLLFGGSVGVRVEGDLWELTGDWTRLGE